MPPGADVLPVPLALTVAESQPDPFALPDRTRSRHRRSWDIACASSTATSSEYHQQGTSNLLANGGFDAILDLGDNQYDVGALSAYQTY